LPATAIHTSFALQFAHDTGIDLLNR
jgi:hypothetical protein